MENFIILENCTQEPGLLELGLVMFAQGGTKDIFNKPAAYLSMLCSKNEKNIAPKCSDRLQDGKYSFNAIVNILLISQVLHYLKDP